jgi:hypothetical protein
LVDAVVREWLHQLCDDGIVDSEEIDLLMAAFFTIFYVDDAYLATRDPDFLQVALTSLVSFFKHLGLEANTKNRVSSAKRVHLAESSFEGQNRKVHKMCAGYREIPNKKFRHGLGFGPIVNWFDPAPVLLVMMLWVGLGILVSTFIKKTG